MHRDSVGTLRLATRADLPALHTLIDASMRALSVGFLSAEQVNAELTFVISADTALIDDGTLYVIELSDGTIAGMGGWSRRRALHGGDAFKQAHGGAAQDELVDPALEPARIRQMFTHPDYARRGIARRIFEASCEAAQRAGFTELILTATMAGVPLYESLGFTLGRPYTDVLPNGIEIPVAEMSRAIAK